MKVCFVHSRYQSLGGEDLAAKAKKELLEKHGELVDLLIDADNAAMANRAARG